MYNETTSQPKLAPLKGWFFHKNGIEKHFVFEDFSKTLAFMVQVGILAEKNGHHPEWDNVYNKLHIRFSTHDAGGLTDKDFLMAEAIEKL